MQITSPFNLLRIEIIMNEQEKKALFRKLLWLFAISFVLSNGHGVLLVNKPTLIAGIPLLYLWALGWGIVQIGIILYAYLRLWRHELEEEIEKTEGSSSGEGA